VLPKGLHPEGHVNVVRLRLRRLRTEQVREKAESCAVDLSGEEGGGGEREMERPEKQRVM
jgi:hypothetical protein